MYFVLGKGFKHKERKAKRTKFTKGSFSRFHGHRKSRVLPGVGVLFLPASSYQLSASVSDVNSRPLPVPTEPSLAMRAVDKNPVATAPGSDKILMSSEISTRNRLWVISELYYPEETSTGYYLTRIAEGLTDKFDVKAISGQPDYSARGTIAPRREIRNGVEIFRAAGTTLNKNVIIFRPINMITLGFSAFFAAARRFRAGDRVLVVTNSPTMPFIVAMASLLRGASYSLLIHDDYPEILIATGKAGESSLLELAKAFFNRWLYKYTARIIVVSRDMKESVERLTDGLDIPVTVIHGWAEIEAVFPAPRS